MAVEVFEVEQGAPAWHELRNSGGQDGLPLIGSSDIPVILGRSPYKTAWKLWMEKTGKQSQEPPTPWMLAGTENEPKARMMYELEHGHYPATVLLDRASGHIASLDGRNPSARKQVEIKCPGEKDHALALEGKVPPKYLPQLAWQLYLGSQIGDEFSDYVSLAPNGKSIEVVPMAVDAAMELYWHIEMLPAVLQFQEWVKTDTEPPLAKNDVVLVEDLHLQLLAEQLRNVVAELQPIKAREKELEDALKAECLKIHPRCDVAGLALVTRFPREDSQWKEAFETAKARVFELEDVIGEGHQALTVPKKIIHMTKVTVRGTDAA